MSRLDAITTVWSRIGDLNTARHGHQVIYDGSYFLVIGGNTDIEFNQGGEAYMTEKCEWAGNNITCVEQQPALNNYRWDPLLTLVREDFGKSFDKC